MGALQAATTTAVDGSRVAWLDMTRGVSILLVVIYHLGLFYDAIGAAPHDLLLFNHLTAPMRLSSFFIIAGMLARSAVIAPDADRLLRRVAMFVWLYLVWSLIRWGFFRYVPNLVTPSEGSSLADWLRSLAVPNSGLWFIWAFAIYLMAARLLLPLGPVVGIGIGALVSFCIYGDLAEPASSGLSNAVRYAVFFMIGLHAAAPLLRIGQLGPGWRFGLVAAYPSLLAVQVTTHALPWPLDPLLAMLTALAGALAVLAACSLLDRGTPARWLAWIGRQTLEIYLAHALVIGGAAYLLKIGPLPRLEVVGSLPAVLILAVLLPLLLKRLADPHGRSWLYHLPGGR